MEKKDNQVKIRLGSLVLMIFSSIFGFSNSLTAFYQMGYCEYHLVYRVSYLVLLAICIDLCGIWCCL